MKQLFAVIYLCTIAQVVESKPYQWHSKQHIHHTKQKAIDLWLAHGVHSTKQLFKTLPQQKIFFWVDIKTNASEAVPWGQVTRDENNTIYLQIAPKATLHQLKNDWTLYHEIAHLYLPFLAHKSTWLGEGFATYIQNVMMLDADIHNRSSFINKIQAGLSRGIKTSKRVSGKIESVSQHMRRNRAYMKVYWTGAAFFLTVDAQLQQQNKNLVDIISTYADCCLTDNESGEALIKNLDLISKTDLFSSQYKHFKQLRSFPTVPQSTIEQVAKFYSGRNKQSHTNN